MLMIAAVELLFDLKLLGLADNHLNFGRIATFKVLHDQGPTHLIDLLTHYHLSRLLRSSAKNLLWNPTYNIKTYGGRFFAVAAPLLCNPLPKSVKDSTSVDTFRRRLKKHLFLSAYYEC